MTDIKFGVFAPPLDEQLQGCGLHSEYIDCFQRDADAIVRLRIRGLLTGREVHASRKRLIKAIERESKC